MNYIDLIILIIVVFTAYRWYKIGFVKTLFLVAGIVVGISIGLLIAPIAMRQFKSEQIKFIAMLLSIGGCTIAIGYLAELAGHHINIRIQKPQLQSLNSATGAVFSLFISLGVIWISAGLIAASPIISLNRQIQDSGVIQFMNKNLPATPVAFPDADSSCSKGTFCRLSSRRTHICCRSRNPWKFPLQYPPCDRALS